MPSLGLKDRGKLSHNRSLPVIDTPVKREEKRHAIIIVGDFPTQTGYGACMSETATAHTPDALLRSLGRLLRPIVRLTIRNGVTFPVLADLLRDLYVDVAQHDVLTDEKSRTDSRISLLTGVHRKEIRRQRTAELAPQPEPPVVTLTSQIIARWQGDAAYRDAGTGAPKPLPRTSDTEPSFDSLVASVTKDVRHRAVLDEWQSQGLVSVDDEGRVTLNVAAFIPKPGREAQLFYFGRNLGDHIAAAAANISATATAPFMDRSMHYDSLPVAVADQLEAMSREAGMKLLIEMNNTAMRMTADLPDDGGPKRRLNLGVYVFVADDAPRAGDGQPGAEA